MKLADKLPLKMSPDIKVVWEITMIKAVDQKHYVIQNMLLQGWEPYSTTPTAPEGLVGEPLMNFHFRRRKRIYPTYHHMFELWPDGQPLLPGES